MSRFPVLNSISFWLTASGVALVNLSLFVGEFARTGWLAYPPLSELAYSPGVGVDYYLWSLQLSGIGTLLSGINLTTTILKLRAPGMGYSAHADLQLDRARFEPADRCRIPGAHRDLRHAVAGPLLRLPLLYQRASAATR